MTDWLDEIEQLADAATPGPWEQKASLIFAHSATGNWTVIADGSIAGDSPAANAKFIAAAREAIPQLIDEVRRLTRLLDMAGLAGDVFLAKLARVEELHKPTSGHNPDCRCGIPAHTNRNCNECGNEWPCPTTRALQGDDQ